MGSRMNQICSGSEEKKAPHLLLDVDPDLLRDLSARHHLLAADRRQGRRQRLRREDPLARLLHGRRVLRASRLLLLTRARLLPLRRLLHGLLHSPAQGQKTSAAITRGDPTIQLNPPLSSEAMQLVSPTSRLAGTDSEHPGFIWIP